MKGHTVECPHCGYENWKVLDGEYGYCRDCHKWFDKTEEDR